MFCREQVARIAARRDEIEAAGGQVIAVGNGSAYWGKAFVAEEKVDYPVFTDPGKRSYDAFGMKRSVLGVLKMKVLSHGKRATKKGFKQTRVRGDPFQLGGVIVLAADGAVTYEHIENEAGDLADLDLVIAALTA